MFEGWFVQKQMSVNELMPYPPYPSYPSGMYDEDDAIYRYSLRESSYPTLAIEQPLFDDERHHVPVGFYELALSDDRQFFILMQSKNPVAIIPVFKVEEDETQVEPQKKSLYQKHKDKKEAKHEQKMRQKYARLGTTYPEKEIYMNASIQKINGENGTYYLIEYEREKIRAWGAVK